MIFFGNSFVKWILMDEFIIEKRLSFFMRIKIYRFIVFLMFVIGDVDYSILEVSFLFSFFRKFCDGFLLCIVN